MKWAKRVAAGLAVAAVLVQGTATQADDKPMMVVLPTGVLPLAVSSSSGVVVGYCIPVAAATGSRHWGWCTSEGIRR